MLPPEPPPANFRLLPSSPFTDTFPSTFSVSLTRNSRTPPPDPPKKEKMTTAFDNEFQKLFNIKVFILRQHLYIGLKKKILSRSDSTVITTARTRPFLRPIRLHVKLRIYTQIRQIDNITSKVGDHSRG